jgi:methylated-DNA-[protein]-cysteine S-methyltransferase
MLHDTDQFVTVFSTSLGWMGLLGTQQGARQLVFGHDTPSEALAALGVQQLPDTEIPDWMQRAVEWLQDYSDGVSVDLNAIPLDLSHRTPFEERVRMQLRKLPAGQTISYGELAAMSGRAGAARAVGTVMSRNPVPLLIPCHRVLAANGKLGGYSAPSGLAMKKHLLRLESQTPAAAHGDS